jgi:exodeoxyribonuclease VII large subunit
MRVALSHQSEKLRMQNPLKSIKECEAHLSQKEKELLLYCHNVLDKYRLRLQQYVSQLESLNPLAVLARGYSIAYKLPDDKVIRNHAEVAAGQRIRVRLSEGQLECLVQKSEPAQERSLEGKEYREQEEG